MAEEEQLAPSRTVPPRLPKTYTVGHERDASPRVGRAVLVVIALVCLGLQGAEFLFLPHASLARLLAAAVRVGFSWVCFLALAAGLGWTRWPLAVCHVGLGVWLEVHAMMGTFAAAYPGVSGGSSLVPAMLGAMFLGAGGWLALSADLSAYLDRERAGITAGSRLATAALLALTVGVPAAGLVLTVAFTQHPTETRAADVKQVPIPTPPQNREGAEFALGLIQRALREQDFGVFTAAMSPELKAQTRPEWTRQVTASLARRGPPRGLELTDVFFNLSIERKRELTYCNVFAVYPDGRVCFHCNLSRDVGTTDWLVDMVFIE